MLDSFSNIIKIKELRTKLLITAALLVIYRLGSFIPVPGVDITRLKAVMDNLAGEGVTGGLVSMADMFTGGALMRGAIFSLGIMPYITASIIFQLLAGIVPSLERLQREGPTGRKKLMQYTRVSTAFLVIFQGAMICYSLLNQRATYPESSLLADKSVMSDTAFYIYGVSGLLFGSMFLMWLGEQIDQFGIGSGISLLIMAGIIARMPHALSSLMKEVNLGGVGSTGNMGLHEVAILLVMFVAMVLAVVLITVGQRRVPVHQAKATRGRRTYGGGRSYLPVRVNQSGVIPIIFAQSLLMLPAMVFNFFGWTTFSSERGYWYIVSYVLLITFFCYFYTAVTYNPNEMADNLKQGGSYIPGIRPGKRTAEYIEKIMTRIALAGAIFLSFVAIVPTFVNHWMGVDYTVSQFLGGTGLLIVVGVALDLVQKVESYLLMKHYDGFVKGRPQRGRR